ncbi:peptide-methionine (S)-S-oxide reductase MsrA [Paenalcaligenes faecalis]|uniref:peptide-methionine (S)-S-oxide reductase MsrA n=1 Tax=Paenalcaligenes faecalis TaxID=2980099 RepID=UPI0022B9CE2F|nr:peptide-methionine (S)-S-oxide reductase MsrA [Paenalcaligenes faecalis]
MTAAVLFGAGCFWCAEPAFAALKGVTFVHPGYSGGKTHYPTYEQVCNQDTGHIEVVQVRYDAEKISFDTLLEVFFSLHDPTTLNRQGNDIGPQYASAIFYTTKLQLQQAKEYIENLEKKLQKPIVTRLLPAEVFWPAEHEHFGYYMNNLNAPYSLAVIQPKLREFARTYKALIKDHGE